VIGSLQLPTTGSADFLQDVSDGVVGMPLVRPLLACARTAVRASLRSKG
jgi:hypothetical protein